MKTRLFFLALGFLLVAAGSVQAQTRTRVTADRRDAIRARREAMVQNRDAIRQRHEAMRDRISSLTAEQRAFLEGLRAERREIFGQVKAGSLTRQDAREAIRAWIQANRPARPGR